MSEATPNPPDPLPDASLNPIDEAEVERIINEASDLTNEIEEQLGAVEAPLGAASDLQPFEEASAPPDVFAQLDEVEAALKEVGEDQGRPVRTAQYPHSKPSVEGDQPDAGVPPPTQGAAAGHKSPSQPADGPMPAETAAAQSGQPTDHHQDASPIRQKETISVVCLLKLRAAFTRTVDAALYAMDVIDGAFVWVGYPARRVLGWIALALFVAACALTASSLS
ncbi:MAG: hypothetical protein V3W34_07940 [Phycisphaerae bacterium]